VVNGQSLRKKPEAKVFNYKEKMEPGVEKDSKRKSQTQRGHFCEEDHGRSKNHIGTKKNEGIIRKGGDKKRQSGKRGGRLAALVWEEVSMKWPTKETQEGGARPIQRGGKRRVTFA